MLRKCEMTPEQLEHKRQYDIAYRSKPENKAKQKKYQRELRAYQQAYYRAHREKALEYQQQYNRQHKKGMRSTTGGQREWKRNQFEAPREQLKESYHRSDLMHLPAESFAIICQKIINGERWMV